MSGNPQATVYVGNLEERVDERLLYEIMVQAGPLVDVYIPRDKETKRHKGYGFAEYSSEKSAQYAVSLFSGLVVIYNKSVRFAISGQDKTVQARESKDLVTSFSVDGNDRLERNSPMSQFYNYPLSSASIHFNGYSQGFNTPTFAHVQSYNARLVSLGHMGLRTPTPNRGYSYVHPTY